MATEIGFFQGEGKM